MAILSRHRAAMIMTGVVGAGLSGLALIAVLQVSLATSLVYTAALFSGLSGHVRAKLDESLQQVLTIRNFFSASDLVERDEFSRFVNPMIEHEPAIRFIAWLPADTIAAKSYFQRLAKKNTGQPCVPEAFSVPSLSIYYIEPCGLYAHQLGRPSGIEALFTVEKSALYKSDLALSLDRTTGNLIVLLAVTSRAVPNKNNIVGYVYALIDLHASVEASIKEGYQNAGLDTLTVTGRILGQGDDVNLYKSDSEGDHEILASILGTHLPLSENLLVLRRLQINFVANESVIDKRGVILGFSVFVLGILTTVFLMRYLDRMYTLNKQLAQEISERETVQDELIQHQERLEEMVKQRTDELESFNYSISHDLRAPLIRIDGFSQILLQRHSDGLDDNGKDFLRRIVRASRLMSEQIDGLLVLSRIGRSDIVRQDVNLSDIAKEIATQLAMKSPERDVAVVIEQDIHANTDRRLMYVLFDNLLSNAWKFTSKISMPRIVIGVQEREGMTVISIQDNGVGFDLAAAEKIFSPFQRLHGDGEYEGTGIGLAIVQRIINRLSGKIWVESTPNIGTTFFVYLPLIRKASGDA